MDIFIICTWTYTFDVYGGINIHVNTSASIPLRTTRQSTYIYIYIYTCIHTNIYVCIHMEMCMST